MTLQEPTVVAVHDALARLRHDAASAACTAMVEDLDKMLGAVVGLAALLEALPDRAAASDGPDELRTIRHDLRTPVGQLLGYCELLQEEAEDEGDARWSAPLAALRGQMDALRRVVEQLSATYAGSAAADTGVQRVVVTSRAQSTESAEGARGTVLVVDDNADNRDLLSRRLERDGYHVVVAHDGKQALQTAAATEIDLVLLDVMMPVMDGYEALARFKATDELRHIPIIMLTSLDEQGSLATCIEAGAEDHLPKPFDPVLLRARLSGSLERKRSRDREREFLAQIVAEKRRADDLIHGVIPIGVALAGERNEARILARTLVEARRFCGADGGMLQLLENDDLIVVQLQCESMQQSESPTATRPPSPSGGVPQRVNLKDERKARRPEVMAAAQGLTINIDIVRDPGDYDLSAVRAFDQSNAYRTRSIVFVPLRADADSDVSGVLQLWNASRPTDGAAIPFTTASVEMLQSLSSLAAAALQAYRRERELRHRIRRLEIKIDERERGTEVAQITETDYFKRLRKQARELRKRSS